jgi:hypothetical protein
MTGIETIEEAFALAEAGFNVRISAGMIEILSNAEVEAIMEAGDE